MWMKKEQSGAKNEDEVVTAIVMPLTGHDDNEVKEFLTGLAAEVSCLAQGFLSVKGSRRALKAVSSIARVEVNAAKQMHGAILASHESKAGT